MQDNGGTANGGVDLDPVANTITINVTAVNDAPAGTDKTVTTLEDTAYTFAAADFGFSDPTTARPTACSAVKITTLPARRHADRQRRRGDGRASSSPLADITAGLLMFTPAANANGAGYASFTFQVQDDGGTANGGVDLDQSANTLSPSTSPPSTMRRPADRQQPSPRSEDTARLPFSPRPTSASAIRTMRPPTRWLR